jgi:hypothetical protein
MEPILSGMIMIKSNTSRGFRLNEFVDRYGSCCSIQKSSLATEDAIWFGVDDAKPQIMVVDAQRLGIPTRESCGWIPYYIPEEVLLTTQMHLTRDQVKELLPILQHFVDTGELP